MGAMAIKNSPGTSEEVNPTPEMEYDTNVNPIDSEKDKKNKKIKMHRKMIKIKMIQKLQKKHQLMKMTLIKLKR